jgi:hypothetical protein
MYPSLAWERLLRALGGRDLKGEIIAEGKKDAVLGYRVPQWLKDELQRLADADDRKLGPYVQRVLERHVAAEKERGGKLKGK